MAVYLYIYLKKAFHKLRPIKKSFKNSFLFLFIKERKKVAFFLKRLKMLFKRKIVIYNIYLSC